MMKVDFPFNYLVSYKYPGKPTFQRETIFDHEKVEFTEFSDTEAHVVHILHSTPARLPPESRYETRDIPLEQFCPPDGKCVVRSLNGKFYASRFPVSQMDEWRGHDQFDCFNFKLPVRDNSFEQVMTDLTARKAPTLHEFQKTKGELRKFETTREYMVDHIRDVAEGFVVIDDVVYEEVFEPVYAVLVSRDRVALTVQEAISPTVRDYQKGNLPGTWYSRFRFGLDERDAALDCARHFSNEMKVEFEDLTSVERFDENSVSFRGEHEALFAMAVRLFERFEKSVKYLDERSAYAFMEARELFSINDRLTPRAVSAIKAMVPLLWDFMHSGSHNVANIRPESYAEVDYHVRDAFGDTPVLDLKRLTYALDRFEQRLDSNLDWFGKGFDALPAYRYPYKAAEITNMLDLQKAEIKAMAEIHPDIYRADKERFAVLAVENMETCQTVAVAVVERANPKAVVNAMIADGHEDIADRMIGEYARDIRSNVSLAKSKPRRAGI